MLRRSTLWLALSCFFFSANAQTLFNETIDVPAGYAPTEVVMPPSPLSVQVLFVGGVDEVETTPTYGNPAGKAIAKEWHDFIGFTPDNASDDLGWVSVNHERIVSDDQIGDGGGMTVFKVKRADDGTLEIVDQTLSDGRSGQFFNVDFVNTVGETGMNCGGICSIVDGRIWTAEEWFRRDNGSIAPVRNQADFTIQNSGIPGWDGITVPKYENFNYMVEIDPREAKAIRKQYNWGRQPFEGGVVAPDNRTVYLGPDATPGFFGMFVANTPGDFTRGTLFAHKHDKPGWQWTPIWEFNFDPDGPLGPQEPLNYFLNHIDGAVAKGATMYNRIEWVAINPENNYVYFTATGRDNPGSRWADENEDGAVHHPDVIARAEAQGLTSPNDENYTDYYGSIWEYNPTTSETRLFLNGGPFFEDSPTEAAYPDKHLSNPDGLNVMQINGKSYLVIQEDLNGTSNGRVPAGVDNRTCELFILDLSIANPTINDLIRLTVVPAGAEVTGAQPTSDGASLLVNVQHPRTDNPFPYNHSLTLAINGFDKLAAQSKANNVDPFQAIEAGVSATDSKDVFSVFPNPTTRTIFLNKVSDIAIFNGDGKRIMVRRNVTEVNVSDLTPGMYFIQNAKGDILKLQVQ
ncbi:MAG: alkaline phosphatase PhoX [Bacteroidota bacterium]